MAKEIKVILPYGFIPKKSYRVVYDEIVDSTNFKSTKDLIRDMTAQELNTSSTKGLYDYPAGSKGHQPTDIELLLRSGKLDKADVEKLSELEKENLLNESESQEIEREKFASKNRTAKIDKLLDSQTNGLS